MGSIKVIMPNGTHLEIPAEGLKNLSLRGGTLPPETELPELRGLYLDGGVWPEGLALPKGLRFLELGGGTLPEGTVLPEGLGWLILGGAMSPPGKLPSGTVLPAGLKELDLCGGTLPPGTTIPEGCHVVGAGTEGIYGPAPVNYLAPDAEAPASDIVSVTAAIRSLHKERAAFITESIAKDSRVEAFKAKLTEKYSYIGVNHFTSMSKFPDMEALVFGRGGKVLDLHPIAPQGEFIGTWGGGDALEMLYKTPSGKERWAYVVRDRSVDDYCETALITGKALNHNQVLDLLWQVEKRGARLGPDRNELPNLPDLENQVAKEVRSVDDAAWNYFNSCDPAFVRELAKANASGPSPNLAEIVAQRVADSGRWREREGIPPPFSEQAEEVEAEMRCLRAAWPKIAALAAAIQHKVSEMRGVSAEGNESAGNRI